MKNMADKLLEKKEEISTSEVSALRREVSEGLKAADFKQVEVAQNQIISLFPTSATHRLDLVEYALKLGKQDRAADYFDDFNRAVRDDSVDPIALRKASVRINLRLGNLTAAAETASEWSDDFGGELENAIYAMRAFARNDEREKFLTAAKAVQALAEDLNKIRPELSHMYNDLGYSKQALALFSDTTASDLHDVQSLQEWGRASLSAEYISEAGHSALERAFELDPMNPRVRQQLATARMRMGDLRKALDLIGDKPQTEERDGMLASRSEIFLEMGRYQEAIPGFERLLEEHPRHRGWRRALVGAHMLNGNVKAAETAYQKDLELRRIPTETGFQSCLEDIELQLATADVPPYRFEWAHERLKHLNAAPNDRREWEDQCRWVNLADHLTLNWIETRSDSVDEFYSLISGAEEGFEELRHATQNGFGCFLATAHVGALFAGPVALAHSDFDYRWVASTPLVSTVPGSNKLLSTYSYNRLQMARECYRAVRKGAIVSLAVDGAISVASRSVPFAGDFLLLSDYVPRAVYQSGVESFFPMSVWREGKVEIELIRLPKPSATDTVDMFADRWLEAFVEALEKMCVRFPDNFRMSGGFWSHVRL